MTLEELLALLPDNTRGDIGADDMRTVVTDLFNRDVALGSALDSTNTSVADVAVVINEGRLSESELNATIAEATAGKANLSIDGQDEIESRRAAVLLDWFSALANRHYQGVNVCIMGDSITEGEGATAWGRQWAGRLRDALRARFPANGSAVGGRGLIPSFMTGSATFTPPATVEGGAVASSGYGPKRASARLNAAGHKVTFNVVGTAIDLFYCGGGSGTATVTIDGIPAANLTTGSTTLDGQKKRYTFGAGGAHTVVVEWVSGTAYVHGVIEFNGDETSGVTIHDASHYGWNTGTGGSGWLQSSTNTWPRSIATLGTDLLVIALGTNDPGINTPAAMKANLETIIALIRAQWTAMAVTAPPIVIAPYGGKSTAAATWNEYVAAMHAVADADPRVIVADMSRRLPNASTNPGAIYADVVGHPTNKGHALIADLMASFLTPR